MVMEVKGKAAVDFLMSQFGERQNLSFLFLLKTTELLLISHTMAHSVELDVLPDADGSCRFSMGAISVLASINGPLEVQRRDELPEEATIDVAVRPSAGLAGVQR